MVQYTCDRCEKIFNIKTHYVNHKNRKFPCKIKKKSNCVHIDISTKIDQNIKKIPSKVSKIDTQMNTTDTQIYIKNIKKKEKLYNCEYCLKNFTTNSSMRRHIKSWCKIKKKHDDKEKKLLQLEIKELRKQNNKIIKLLNKQNRETVINNTMNITQNNNTNITNNQVKIVAFGEEDLDQISSEVFKKILKRGYQSVPQLIKHVHFNKDLPEYHNVVKSNMRDNKLSIFDGNKFILVDKQEILEKLYDEKSDIIEIKYDELKDELPKSTTKKIERFLNDRDIEKHKMLLLSDIDLLAYNDRYIPLQTKKYYEKTKNLCYNKIS